MRQFALASLIVFTLLVSSTRVVSATVLPEQASSAAGLKATPAPEQPVATPTPLNITLSPVTLNLQAKPGETVTAPIKLRNNGSETEKLTVSFDTFKADSSGQKPQLMNANPNDPYMQWVSVDESAFNIEPNEWKTIHFTFSPPADAALTYYYTIVFNRASIAPLPGQTNIEGAPAILVLTNVLSPNAKRELQVDSFSVTHSITEFLPIDFKLNVHNTGNVHSAPSGTIFIDGQGQKDIAVISINNGGSMVLPETRREFNITWDDGFPSHDENGKLNWDTSKLNKIRFGKYTAHMIMVYDNGERDVPIESFITFWVIPWRIIAAGIALPVLPAVIVFIVMKLLYRKRKE